jgi:hypothetical protein
VHLFDPHAPYVPPPAFARQAGGDPYLGEVARADAGVGALLDELARLDLDDETLVVVVSDHGEGLGDHGEVTHGSLAYDTTLRVPLIVRHPDGRRAGTRSDEAASVVDVLPTVAAALGLEAPAGIDGVDLGEPLDGAERGIFFETSYGFLHYGWSPISGWIEGGLKYVHDAEPQLFDVAANPAESRDLLRDRGADAERGRRGLATVASLPRLAPGSQGDPALMARLRALGYATAGADREIPDPLDPTALPAARRRLGELEVLARAGDVAGAGRPGEAAELLAGVLAENPRNRTAAERRATYLIAAGRCGEAVAVFETLVAEGSRTPEVFLNLGYCLQLAGRDEEAVEQFLVAHDLDPGNTSVLRNLVVVLRRLGRQAEAQRFQALFESAVGATRAPR